ARRRPRARPVGWARTLAPGGLPGLQVEGTWATPVGPSCNAARKSSSWGAPWGERVWTGVGGNADLPGEGGRTGTRNERSREVAGRACGQVCRRGARRWAWEHTLRRGEEGAPVPSTGLLAPARENLTVGRGFFPPPPPAHLP